MISPQSTHRVHDRLVVLDLARFLMQASGVALIVLAVGVVVTGNPVLPAALTAGTGIAIVVGCLVLRRHLQRRHGLDPAQLDALLISRAKRTERNSEVLSTQKCAADLETALGRRAITAAESVHDIERTDSAALDSTISLDPDHEADQIVDTVLVLRRLRQRLGARPSPATELALEEWDSVTLELDRTRSTVQQRVVALEAYTATLRAVSDRSEQQRAEARLSAVAYAALSELPTIDASHQLATEQIIEHEEHLRDALDGAAPPGIRTPTPHEPSAAIAS